MAPSELVLGLGRPVPPAPHARPRGLPLTLPGLTLPGLILPGLTLPGLTLPGLILPGLTLPGLILLGLILLGLTLLGPSALSAAQPQPRSAAQLWAQTRTAAGGPSAPVSRIRGAHSVDRSARATPAHRRDHPVPVARRAGFRAPRGPVIDTPTTLWSTPTTQWSTPTTQWSTPTTQWSTHTTQWSAPTTQWSTPFGGAVQGDEA